MLLKPLKSMEARGYGSAARTSCSEYPFRFSDTLLLIVYVILFSSVTAAACMGCIGFVFYPELEGVKTAGSPTYTAIAYLCFGLMSLLPFLTELKELVQWNFCRSKNLSFEYPKRPKKALNNISFSVKKGEFVLLYGASGCGKTTLLQTLMPQIAPGGHLSGSITFNGKDISSSDVGDIGFVSQQPDGQIVTDRVWSELAFGPENLGIKPNITKRRIAEISNYFGMQDWFYKCTYELSGGQKQMLNLASVMVTQPKLLLLDEPTGQLDPVAASEFISTLRKINSQFGVTVVLSEHRIEDIFPYADKILVMENGELLFDGTPENACIKLKNYNIFTGFPASAKIWKELDVRQPCPVSVKDGKNFLENICIEKDTINTDNPNMYLQSDDTENTSAVQIKNIWFRYGKEDKRYSQKYLA